MISQAKILTNQLQILDSQIISLLDIHTDINQIFDKLISNSNEIPCSIPVNESNKNKKNNLSCFKIIEIYIKRCFVTSFYLIAHCIPKNLLVCVGTPNNICNITPKINTKIVTSSKGKPVINDITNAPSNVDI